MSFFKKDLQRHHNPRFHVIAVVCAAAEAFPLVRHGLPGHRRGRRGSQPARRRAPVAEYRHPHYGQQWAEEHIRNLRERAAREPHTSDDAEHS